MGLLAEKRAAVLAAAHANTPSVVLLDTLGRPFLSIAHNKDDSDDDEYFETKTVMDIQGNVLGVIDARGIEANPIYYAEERVYGMLGQPLEVISHDAGDRDNLLTALGEPMRSWDDRNQRFSVSYDTPPCSVVWGRSRENQLDGGNDHIVVRKCDMGSGVLYSCTCGQDYLLVGWPTGERRFVGLTDQGEYPYIRLGRWGKWINESLLRD